MGRRRVDAGVPECPQHPEGRVVRNGLYGSPVRRQLWRCRRGDGSTHTFAGAVVRTVLHEAGSCDSCEQHVEKHQGPGVASRYRFPVLEVALALVRVGRGMTYSEAARRAKMRTERGATPTAQLVGNWIEVFGPVVAAPWQEEWWPETVVLDSTPYEANTPGGGSGVVFSVLAAYGYDAGVTNGRLVAVEAVGGNVNGAHWQRFFRRMQGSPRLVVTDHDTATINAVRTAWPDTTIRLCRWHLKRKLSEVLRPVVRRNPTSPLAIVDETVLDTAEGWNDFCALVASAREPVLDGWVKRRARLLADEFAAADLPDVWGNGAVEQALQRIEGFIGQRAFCFRNAERTNRFLELARLHLNRQDDTGRYATAIRNHLADLGQPAPQLLVRDRGAPSLR